jgi:spore maturation protein CgeB
MFQGTRVLLIGRFDDTFNAHSALKRRALERLGCSVTTFDPSIEGMLDRIRRLDLTARLIRALGQAAPDLVLVLGSEELSHEQIKMLRTEVSPGTTWVNWSPGDIRSLAKLRTIAGVFDRMFVTGTDLEAALRREIGEKAVYLPHACDPSFHRPMRARGEFRANVVFAGEATSRREQLLASLAEFGLALWGPGWRKTSLRDYCRGELPLAEDYVRAYAGASVAINIHHSVDPEPQRDSSGCNPRVFELAGIGAPQVVDLRMDLPRHFEDNAELLVFHSPEELKGLVKRALQDNAYRERFGAAGRERALHEHTYMHRLQALLKVAVGGR